MAYAGLTLYLAAFGALLISREWPPDWLKPDKQLTDLLITSTWALALFFVKWELLRRRWAALRVAGIERLMAKWTSNDPSNDDLLPWEPKKVKKTVSKRVLSYVGSGILSLLIRVMDYVVPLPWAQPTVDITQAVYPTALVNEWKEQEGRGTSALVHEGLLLFAGWAMYLSLLVHTLPLTAGRVTPLTVLFLIGVVINLANWIRKKVVTLVSKGAA
jgi:hypothetical protein